MGIGAWLAPPPPPSSVLRRFVLSPRERLGVGVFNGAGGDGWGGVDDDRESPWSPYKYPIDSVGMGRDSGATSRPAMRFGMLFAPGPFLAPMPLLLLPTEGSAPPFECLSRPFSHPGAPFTASGADCRRLDLSDPRRPLPLLMAPLLPLALVEAPPLPPPLLPFPPSPRGPRDPIAPSTLLPPAAEPVVLVLAVPRGSGAASPAPPPPALRPGRDLDGVAPNEPRDDRRDLPEVVDPDE